VNSLPAAIRFQHTPNPNAGKFTADRPVVPGKASKSYYSAAQAAADPLAAELFALAGVASLFMVEDFVTVTKEPDADWQLLAPRVIETMQRALP
jgi:hypothetical protein